MENLLPADAHTLVSGEAWYYWNYQFRLGKEVLVPYMKSAGLFRAGQRVAEIGCAEGGVLAAFAEAGGGKVLGTDIEAARLESGRIVFAQRGLDATFTTHNIFQDAIPEAWQAGFDLVILRDVIEHLENTEACLRNIRTLLAPTGILMVAFPPFASPYGGHQHLLKNFWGNFPYIHLLPDVIFKPMIASGRPPDVVEVERLRHIRLSPKKFIRAALAARFSIVREEYYLLRPVFKMKFGLPTVSLTPLAWLPLIKETLSLEAFYLLQPSQT